MMQTPALTRFEEQRGLRISIWEGAWATVFGVLTGGAFVTGFALMLGASPLVMGLMAGLPAAVGLLQLPAALAIGRARSRKSLVGWSAFAGRALFAPMLAIPFLVPPPLRIPVFLILLTASAALQTITVPAWTSWMSDLVPASSRGQYFGRRNMIAGIVTVLVPLPAGAFLDQAVKQGRFDPRLGFAVLFLLATAAAVVSLILIGRQPEPPMTAAPVANPLRSLAAPLSNPNFRNFLIFSSIIGFGQSIAGQFFTVWQLDTHALALPYLTVQVLGAVAAGAGLAAMPALGYLGDRFGSRPVLALCSLSVLIPPLLWAITVPGAYWFDVAIIVVLNTIAGIGWAGVGLTRFNLLLGIAEPETRAAFVALFSAFTGVVSGIAPILGGALIAGLASVSVPFGPIVLNNYKLLFLLSAVLRAVSLIYLFKIRETDSRSTRFVIEQLVSTRSVSSYRALKRLRLPQRETERREAVDELAELRSPLAVTELVAALDDVSPEVRERAARALGTIRDFAATPALMAKLSDPAAGIGEAAADALREIASVEAVPALVTAARGPDAGVRGAALRALGSIPGGADRDDVAVVLRFSLSTAHAATCEAACAAVSALAESLPPAVAATLERPLIALLDPAIDRGMRMGAARALGALGGKSRTPGIFEEMARRLTADPDPAVRAQGALALCRVGKAEDKPASQIVDCLLPVLVDPMVRGLAYKQVLQALGDAGLPYGTFYPYLSLNETARDEAFQQIFLEVGRGRRERSRPAAQALAATLAAYTAGDYPACLAALKAGIATARVSGSAATALHALEAVAEKRAIGPEEVLLALLLIRRLRSNDADT
jgi:HEAT repeat protein